MCNKKKSLSLNGRMLRYQKQTSHFYYLLYAVPTEFIHPLLVVSIENGSRSTYTVVTVRKRTQWIANAIQYFRIINRKPLNKPNSALDSLIHPLFPIYSPLCLYARCLFNKRLYSGMKEIFIIKVRNKGKITEIFFISQSIKHLVRKRKANTIFVIELRIPTQYNQFYILRMTHSI